jgi:hypothetical protein
MNTSLLTLAVKAKRDVLRARQLARLAADLLGFNSAEQSCLAAATFDLICQAHAPKGRMTVCFQIAEDCLVITFQPRARALRAAGLEATSLRISKLLPANRTIAYEDVAFAMRQFQELAPLDLFEEMRKVNQDLLTAMVELNRNGEATPSRVEISAA